MRGPGERATWQDPDSGMFDLHGRVVVVTGGAGMLAGEFAEALVEHGASLILADVDEAECERRAVALDPDRGRAVAVRCDVSRREEWQNLLGVALGRFGRVDVLVNNAAVTNASRSPGYASGFFDHTQDDWNAVLSVNLTGAFLGCQVIGEHLIARRSGSIINVASHYGVVSPQHRIYEGTGVCQPVAYSVSKAGLLALTRYLACQWGGHGVRVNALSPGGVFDGHDEPFVSRYAYLCPARRMAERHEMRGAIVFLASAASSYCNGHNLIVDGGWTAW